VDRLRSVDILSVNGEMAREMFLPGLDIDDWTYVTMVNGTFSRHCNRSM
jgi:hypothetical protein